MPVVVVVLLDVLGVLDLAFWAWQAHLLTEQAEAMPLTQPAPSRAAGSAAIPPEYTSLDHLLTVIYADEHDVDHRYGIWGAGPRTGRRRHAA